MGTRTVVGNLAADPDVVQAGSIQITKFRVVENTGDYRGGKFVEHEVPTTHYVEAKFELGQNVASSLHKGDAVVVVGREHTSSWQRNGETHYGRVIEADHVAANLSWATVDVTRIPRAEAQPA